LNEFLLVHKSAPQGLTGFTTMEYEYIPGRRLGKGTNHLDILPKQTRKVNY